MHTTTFYSFKGGVGRTLALVNIGVEFANTGRKVLLVDFDLEAPGVDTFDELKAPEGQAGVVDFVTDYIESGTPPDFANYHYRAALSSKDGGELWVMPAGRRDSQYATKLASIDWQQLYSEMDGFLLLEDLKEQWAEHLKPDYVLIDSRTGHTEVGGICTRQLPDTVVVLFIPNEQNLAGLVGVVESIRREEKRTERRPINLEFVASNVPNLDDEEEILKRMMKVFSKRLEFARWSKIDRYDSLQLLNQSVFVLKRPKSRLAHQYRKLLQRIEDNNPDDSAAALRVVSAQLSDPPPLPFDPERMRKIDNRIDEILAKHSENAEILSIVGQIYKGRGKSNEAETLFQKAAQIALDHSDPAAPRYLLEAVEARCSSGKADIGSVRADLIQALQLETLGVEGIRRAVDLLQRISGEPPEEFPQLASVRKLSRDELWAIASRMNVSREWQRVAFDVIFRDGQTVPELGSSDMWRNEAILTSIGLGRFDIAISLIDESKVSAGTADQSDCFNLGMARWGIEQKIPTELFARVVELDSKSLEGIEDANYEQCLALAEFAIGNHSKANERINESRRLMETIPIRRFSCWQYLLLEPREFLRDLTTMERFFSGSRVLPAFMRQKRIKPPSRRKQST